MMYIESGMVFVILLHFSLLRYVLTKVVFYVFYVYLDFCVV